MNSTVIDRDSNENGGMANPAKIDLLIPAYNAEATLAATLRSVRLQTLPLESVTVVDDGSRDRTADIARSYEGVRYVRNEKNLGCAGNWNRCLELAKADFICLLHADDLLVPCWHERVQEDIRLADVPLDTAYYMGAARFADRGAIVEAFSFAPAAQLYPAGCLLKRLWRHCFYGLTTSACMIYGRNVLARLGRFPGDAYPNMPDVPFHWTLLLDHPIVYDPALTVLIRRGAPNQVGLSRRTELAIGALTAYEAVSKSIADALEQTTSRTTVEYLFPYAVLAFLGKPRREHEVPVAVMDAFRAALGECGKTAFVVAALRELQEKVRRGWIRRRWAQAVESMLLAIEGKEGCLAT